jgi:hypothetical protein
VLVVARMSNGLHTSECAARCASTVMDRRSESLSQLGKHPIISIIAILIELYHYAALYYIFTQFYCLILELKYLLL